MHFEVASFVGCCHFQFTAGEYRTESKARVRTPLHLHMNSVGYKLDRCCQSGHAMSKLPTAGDAQPLKTKALS